MDKKILILLPIWGREKITTLCFDNLKELQKDFNIEVLCVVSEQWAKLLAMEYGFKQVSAPNECLGTKMNIGVEYAKTLSFDYMMNLGSDDIITKDLFKCYEPYFEKEIGIFGSTRLTFIDSSTKEAKEFNYSMMMGAGRCIRKDILIEYTKEGMYDKIQNGLDWNSMKRFIRHSHTEVKNPFNTIYDIKSGENIWKFNELPKGEKLSFENAVSGLTTNQIDRVLEL